MYESLMSVREAIESYFVDGDGGYNRGISNGFTIVDIINKMEIPNNADNRRNVQVRILQVLKIYRSLGEGLLAGGMGHKPTTYLIAETPEEENEIIKRHMRYTNSALCSLDTRLLNSDSAIIKSMVYAVEGMIKSMNSLMIGVDE